MSKKKKKKNKKKRLMRFRELQGLEQVAVKKEVASQAEDQTKNEELKVESPAPQEVSSSERVEPENKVFKKDLKRVSVIILICLVILVGLMFIFQHTNLSSSFNFLLLR